LVKSGLLKRLTLPTGATRLSPEDWHTILDQGEDLQVVRAGCTDEQWRKSIAPLIFALSERSESTFLVLDEAHRLAPQGSKYPSQFDTLATTWHGSGMGVLWVFQRFAKIDKDILSQCTTSVLGGFQSGADIDQVEAVEYPAEVHLTNSERVHQSLPEELLVDGEPLTLRRFTDDNDLTIGSEWIYSDDTTLQRVNSQEWEMNSTHYGTDRKRISHPFE
jgi:hypothetical protein